MSIFCGPAAIAKMVNFKIISFDYWKCCKNPDCTKFELSKNTVIEAKYCSCCGLNLDEIKEEIVSKKSLWKILQDLEKENEMRENHFMDMFCVKDSFNGVFFLPNKRYEKRSFDLENSLIYDAYIDIAEIDFEEEISYFEKFYQTELEILSRIFTIEYKWIIRDIS